MNKPTDRAVFQNVWVVSDIESACMKWVNEPGVGACFLADYTPWTLGFEADLRYMESESLGYAAANTGKVRHIGFAYVDTRPLVGCMLEAVTKTEGAVASFEEIAEAARNRDGKGPIRQCQK